MTTKETTKDLKYPSWEYLILNIDEHDFNNLGKIGYELVAVDQGKAYFKRPLINISYEKLVKDIINGFLDTPLW